MQSGERLEQWLTARGNYKCEQTGVKDAISDQSKGKRVIHTTFPGAKQGIAEPSLRDGSSRARMVRSMIDVSPS